VTHDCACVVVDCALQPALDMQLISTRTVSATALCLAAAITAGAWTLRSHHERAATVTSAPEDPDYLRNKMRYCPVTLAGVTTDIEDIAGGIGFTLHASSPELAAEVESRARELVAFSAGRGFETHGDGHGGGFMRHCPVVTRDTRITAEAIADGVRIAVTPIDAAHLAEVRAATRERMTKVPDRIASFAK
jgi:hypothetical protein